MATIRCDICGREFDKPSRRNQHIKDTHSMSNESKNPAVQVAEPILTDERAMFEAWFAKDDGSLRSVERSGPGYKLMQAQLSWVAWQAGRAVAPSEPVAKVTKGEFGPGLAFLANGKDSPRPGTLLYTAAQSVQVSGAPKLQDQPLCNSALRAEPASQHDSNVADLIEFTERSIRDHADFCEDLESLSDQKHRPTARRIRREIYDTIDARVRNAVKAALATQSTTVTGATAEASEDALKAARYDFLRSRLDDDRDYKLMEHKKGCDYGFKQGVALDKAIDAAIKAMAPASTTTKG